MDPDGRIPAPVVAALIGAAIGAGVSATSAIIAGKSGSEVFAAAVGGAVDGGISAIAIIFAKPALGNAITSTLGGGLGNAVEQSLNIVFGNQENFDFLDVGVSAATGTVVNAGSEFLGNQGESIIKDAINSESTVKTLWKEAKASIKNSGKKPTPAKVKNMVEENKKLMEDTATETLEISIKAVEYSFGFYNELYDEK